MRKLVSLIMVLVMSLGLSCAWAEAAQDNFLISDWKLFYSLGDFAIAEQTIFIYEDNTFEAMDENESKKGTWTFDGETLALTSDDETLSLKWNKENHQFTGNYNGMTITMYMSVEAESKETTDSTAGAPAGGEGDGPGGADAGAVRAGRTAGARRPVRGSRRSGLPQLRQVQRLPAGGLAPLRDADPQRRGGHGPGHGGAGGSAARLPQPLPPSRRLPHGAQRRLGRPARPAAASPLSPAATWTSWP